VGGIHPAGRLALRLWPILLVSAALMPGAAWAQRTAIVPDSAGTTISTAGHVSTIDGGTLAGTNLFHSFATFDLASGDTARWTTTLTDPAKVTNVISRVTGGEVSKINGALDSTGLPKAAFFFINPAGIVFGKDASVNVPGAAWFSTGKQLRFADGTSLSATTATGSTFTVATPQSFGFLGQEGDIALRGTTKLIANPASSAALVGGNLTISDVGASVSGILLAAAGDHNADFPLDGKQVGALNGSITVEGSIIAVDAGSEGGAILRGGHVTLDNTQITTTGGAEIKIEVGDLNMSGQSVLKSVATDLTRAGKIGVQAADLKMRANAEIASLTFSSSDAGTIIVKADNISLEGNASIATNTEATGNAGSIWIQTRGLHFDGGDISSKSIGCIDGLCQGGRSGEVTIAAETIGMSGAAEITTLSVNSAQAGDVIISAPRISIVGASRIASANIGTAPIADVILAGTASRDAFLAGSVLLNATRLIVADGGSITTHSTSGAAGIITVAMPPRVDLLLLDGKDQPGVISTSSGPGTGGMITISNPLAIIFNGGTILANGRATGVDVKIASRYFIQAADRPSGIAVDGSIQLQSNLYDVSLGTTPSTLDFLDASKVLLGQCASARATGEASRIIWRNTGPYAFRPARRATLATGALSLPEMPPC